MNLFGYLLPVISWRSLISNPTRQTNVSPVSQRHRELLSQTLAVARRQLHQHPPVNPLRGHRVAVLAHSLFLQPRDDLVANTSELVLTSFDGEMTALQWGVLAYDLGQWRGLNRNKNRLIPVVC